MNKYRIIIFKQFNLIPEIFTMLSPHSMEEICKIINTGLNGNAISFTDMKGQVRFYDRNVITKIFIKTIECDYED